MEVLLVISISTLWIISFDSWKIGFDFVRLDGFGMLMLVEKKKI